MKAKHMIVLIIVAAAIVLLTLNQRPLPVQVANSEQAVAVEVFGLGEIDARIISQPGFELAGALQELQADVGYSVRQGELLARLDSTGQQARVAQADADLAQARARVHAAAARLRKAKAASKLAQSMEQRRTALAAEGFVSTEAVDQARAERDAASAEQAMAESELELARTAVVAAEAQLQTEQVRLRQHALVAPFDGLVVHRQYQVGTAINPGQPVFVLLDPTTFWIRAYIDEAEAGRLAVGQSAVIQLRSLPGRRFQGQIVRIDPESDRATEERRIYLSCADCPTLLHLGEQAEVVINIDVLDNAILVPEHILERESENRARVWTVNQGRLQLETVALGPQLLDGRVQILELPNGASPLVKLPRRLREGRRATLIAEAGR